MDEDGFTIFLTLMSDLLGEHREGHSMPPIPATQYIFLNPPLKGLTLTID